MSQFTRTIIFTFVLMLAGAAGLGLSIYLHQDRNETRMATYHYPLSFVAQLKNDPKAGEKVYQTYCVSCHAAEPLAQVHAPRINDTVAWEKILKSSRATIQARTQNGYKTMPARGGCFECSDALLNQAVDYMIQESKAKASG